MIEPPYVGLRGQQGMTMIELCIVILVLGVLMVTGIAALLRARTAGNEASAISALRTINSAQLAYASGCGAGSFAASLVVLATVPPGNSQGYVSQDLGSSMEPTRSGYTFRVQSGEAGATAPDDCHGNETRTNYYATAAPTVLGQTGSRAFATNQAGVIWQARGAVPPGEPFGPPAQIAQ